MPILDKWKYSLVNQTPSFQRVPKQKVLNCQNNSGRGHSRNRPKSGRNSPNVPPHALFWPSFSVYTAHKDPRSLFQTCIGVTLPRLLMPAAWTVEGEATPIKAKWIKLDLGVTGDYLQAANCLMVATERRKHWSIKSQAQCQMISC